VLITDRYLERIGWEEVDVEEEGREGVI